MNNLTFIMILSLNFIEFLFLFGYIYGSENLSFQRPAFMSDALLEINPWIVVDGDLSQDDAKCIQTAGNSNMAWWQVRLATRSSIERLDIYYKKSTTPFIQMKRFAGFSVYVSNGTSVLSGRRCYHHQGPEYPELIQNIPCLDDGRIITVVVQRPPEANFTTGMCYSDEAMLELCEVEVFGCAAGFYGSDCTRRCPSGCRDNQCDPVTGNCRYGCNDFYSGARCDKVCSEITCSEYCPTNCANNICDFAGNCLEGCNPGWQGNQCQTACGANFYGENCKWRCYCDHGSCDNQNGTCPDNMCLEGWMPPTCSQVALQQADDTIKSSSVYIGMAFAFTVIAGLVVAIAFLVCRQRNMVTRTPSVSRDGSTETFASLSRNENRKQLDYIIPNAADKRYTTQRLPKTPTVPKHNQYLDLPTGSTYIDDPVSGKHVEYLEPQTQANKYEFTEEEEGYYTLST